MSTKIQNTDDVVLDQTSQENTGHENIELDNETNELLSIGLQKNDSDDGKVSEDTGEDTTEEDLEVIDSVNDIKIPKRFDGESEVAYNMSFTQIITFLTRKMNMLVGGFTHCYYISYNPNFEESIVFFKIEADKDKHEKLLEGFKKGEEMIKSIQHKLTHHEQKNKD